MAVASLPFGCATAFMAVLLCEKIKLQKLSRLAPPPPPAAPQKRRGLRPGIFCITNSYETKFKATIGWTRMCGPRYLSTLTIAARESPEDHLKQVQGCVKDFRNRLCATRKGNRSGLPGW